MACQQRMQPPLSTTQGLAVPAGVFPCRAWRRYTATAHPRTRACNVACICRMHAGVRSSFRCMLSQRKTACCLFNSLPPARARLPPPPAFACCAVPRSAGTRVWAGTTSPQCRSQLSPLYYVPYHLYAYSNTMDNNIRFSMWYTRGKWHASCMVWLFEPCPTFICTCPCVAIGEKSNIKIIL